MIGLIAIGFVGLVFLGLFGTYIHIHYKDTKAAGPLPWEFGYDRAREERIMREEEAKRIKNKVKVNININEIL